MEENKNMPPLQPAENKNIPVSPPQDTVSTGEQP
jgi:hypothetical protein